MAKLGNFRRRSHPLSSFPWAPDAPPPPAQKHTFFGCRRGATYCPDGILELGDLEIYVLRPFSFSYSTISLSSPLDIKNLPNINQNKYLIVDDILFALV